MCYIKRKIDETNGDTCNAYVVFEEEASATAALVHNGKVCVVCVCWNTGIITLPKWSRCWRVSTFEWIWPTAKHRTRKILYSYAIFRLLWMRWVVLDGRPLLCLTASADWLNIAVAPSNYLQEDIWNFFSDNVPSGSDQLEVNIMNSAANSKIISICLPAIRQCDWSEIPLRTSAKDLAMSHLRY